MEEKKKKLEMIMPELRSLEGAKEEEKYTTIFEGFNGFKTAFEKQIDVCSSGDEILVLGLSPQKLRIQVIKEIS